MSEPAQPTTKTSAELLKMQEEFNAKAAKEAAELNRQIEAAVEAERLQRIEADFKRFMPGDDKAVLKGHDFVFMVNKTKGGSGYTGSALGAARDIFMTAKTLGDAAGMTVTASLWGDSYGSVRDIPLIEHNQVNSAAKETKVEEKDFLKAADVLLLGNMAAKPSDSKKHYVIVCDGNISSNVEHIVPVVEAATKINPRITIDFVTCNAEAGNIEKLLSKWSELSSVQKPNLVRVGTAKEVGAAVMNVVKARIAGEVFTAQPQPTATTAPKSTPSA